MININKIKNHSKTSHSSVSRSNASTLIRVSTKNKGLNAKNANKGLSVLRFLCFSAIMDKQDEETASKKVANKRKRLDNKLARC